MADRVGWRWTPPLPPNRTGGSPASGFPVGGSLSRGIGFSPRPKKVGQTFGAGQVNCAWLTPPPVSLAALASVLCPLFYPSFFHLPAFLRSTVVTRFFATTDALTPPTRCADSLPSHPPALAVSLIVASDFRPFRLQPSVRRPGTARLPGVSASGLSPALQASSFPSRLARPHDRIEFTAAALWTTCVTDWSFSFRCSPPRIAATQLRFDTARFLTAQKRTSPLLPLAFSGALGRALRCAPLRHCPTAGSGVPACLPIPLSPMRSRHVWFALARKTAILPP